MSTLIFGIIHFPSSFSVLFSFFFWLCSFKINSTWSPRRTYACIIFNILFFIIIFKILWRTQVLIILMTLFQAIVIMYWASKYFTSLDCMTVNCMSSRKREENTFITKQLQTSLRYSSQSTTMDQNFTIYFTQFFS